MLSAVTVLVAFFCHANDIMATTTITKYTTDINAAVRSISFNDLVYLSQQQSPSGLRKLQMKLPKDFSFGFPSKIFAQQVVSEFLDYRSEDSGTDKHIQALDLHNHYSLLYNSMVFGTPVIKINESDVDSDASTEVAKYSHKSLSLNNASSYITKFCNKLKKDFSLSTKGKAAYECRDFCTKKVAKEVV